MWICLPTRKVPDRQGGDTAGGAKRRRRSARIWSPSIDRSQVPGNYGFPPAFQYRLHIDSILHVAALHPAHNLPFARY